MVYRAMGNRARRPAFVVAALLAAATLAVSLAAWAQHPSVTLEVHKSASYGPHLTDGQGRALYLFTGDRQATATLPAASHCNGSCAEVWPPLVAFGKVRAASRARDALLGRVQRPDGSPQVTYNGWPLYYSMNDRDPGQPTGHNAHRFGGGWSLVTPQGRRLDGGLR